jgi:hypothetical protein
VDIPRRSSQTILLRTVPQQVSLTLRIVTELEECSATTARKTRISLSDLARRPDIGLSSWRADRVGGDIFVVDDPVKPVDANSAVMRANLIDWAANTLMSRMDDKRTGAVIIVMQRLQDNALTGHLLRQGGWRLVSLPAIATRHEAFWLGRRQFHERYHGDLLHPAYETPEVL